jgi:5-methyltetrahydrofolate--homocysteine methyltransferase
MSRQEEILDALYDHVLEGQRDPTVALTNEGLELGMDPLTLLFEAMIPALEEVGRLFEIGEYFVPEMLISARAMQGAMEILQPLIAASGAEPLGTFVMGTVKGDIHDIGKNLCNTMLKGAGFTVVDLGVNVPPEKFVEAIQEHEPQAVGLIAFLTTTMPMFKTNIEAIESAGLRDRVKILVGGAPVNQEYADVVGADGFAPDASSTVRLTKRLLGISEGRTAA